MNTLEIIREMEQDESLRAALRAVILGDEILSLPNEMRLLTAEVKKLAEAQQRTENAQQRTEEAVKELVAAQLRTENAQRHTDETVKSLEEMVKELAEAQRHTENAQRHTDETVKELANAQRHTDETVKELANAQRHTDETVRELKESVNRLNESVGEIAEESCALVLGAMAEERGWTVLDKPGPIDVGQGEVDVRGRFDTPDGEVVVLAEAKSRLQGKYVERWADRVGDPAWRKRFLYPGFNGKVLPYMYGTLIYSDVDKQAKKRGIGVIKYNGEYLAPRPL
ncbi:MAG: hypothetical protein M1456_06795 [Actinobacteria bacterium]|nr:hypothetical protein [Actinomycetota bacterium]